MADRSAPQYIVRAVPDGGASRGVRVELGRRVVKFRYVDSEKQHDKLQLTLDNEDLLLHDDPAFRKGMLLEVSWGYPGNMAPMRQVVVTKITGGRQIIVEARSKAVLLNVVRRSRTFEGLRRSDVARQIGQEAGYDGDQLDIEDTEAVFPVQHQARLTDAQFMARLAHREGFLWYIDQNGWHFHRRRVGQAPAKVLKYFTDPAGTIVDYNIENDITARPARVRARGRDPLNGQTIDETADDTTDSDRPTLTPTLELIDPETGRGTEVDRRIASEDVQPTSAPTAEVARREAVGRFRRVQQVAVKMTLDLIGDPGMLAKTVIEVQGMGQRLSQKYYVREVEHELGPDNGYDCKAHVVSDGTGGHSTRSTIAHGLELLDGGPTTHGRPNQQTPQPGSEDQAPTEGAPLEPVSSIDAETGRETTTYREARGAQRDGSGGTTTSE